MSKSVAISFEGENIRIVYASHKKGGFQIDDILMLKDEQFDGFLEKEKIKEFIVSYHFKSFYQDIISIPTVKKKYIKKLVEAEIKKRVADFNDFSFIHLLHGEKVVENKRVLEIFVYAVKNEEINNIIKRFTSKGKFIKAIYPIALSVATTAKSIEGTFLCVTEIGLDKILVLMKDGQIQFVRNTHSFEKGLNDFDIQNINMTINYCRQSLRVNPSFVMLTGSICNHYSGTSLPSIPVICALNTPNQPEVGTELLDFICPFSALFVAKGSEINLLTSEYKNFYTTMQFLRYSTILFVFLTFIGIFYAGFVIKNCIEFQNKLNLMRADSHQISDLLSKYEKKKTETEQYKPFIISLNNSMLSPDCQKFLFLLSNITTDKIKIESISLNASSSSLTGQLKGHVKSDSFANMQVHYQRFINSIGSLEGFKIKTHNLDIKDRKFQVEVEYQ